MRPSADPKDYANSGAASFAFLLSGAISDFTGYEFSADQVGVLVIVVGFIAGLFTKRQRTVFIPSGRRDAPNDD